MKRLADKFPVCLIRVSAKSVGVPKTTKDIIALYDSSGHDEVEKIADQKNIQLRNFSNPLLANVSYEPGLTAANLKLLKSMLRKSN